MVEHPKFPETIPALQGSWAKVGAAVGLEPAGVLFFQRIFAIAPEALALFSFKDEPSLYDAPKFREHAIKVMKTVDVAVGMLTDVANLLPVLEGLGEKHKYYGILPPHYDVVGQALLETLALGLGDEFTPALKAAWAEIYGVISSTMIKGAKYEEKTDEEYYKGYAKPINKAGEENTKKSMESAMDWFMSGDPASRGTVGIDYATA